MNNIYKVIWSKAKNCYVVASEIARSHTKSASGSEKIGGVTRRSLLASLMALSLLCGGLGVASAANSTVHVDESASGAAEVYTRTGVDTLLNDYGKKTDVEDNKNNIATLRTTTTDQGKLITENATNIACNTADIEKKIDRETANATYATKDALNNLTTTVTGKADEADVNKKLAQKADLTALEAKADRTYVDQKFTEAGTNVDNKLEDYYNKAEVDGKIKAEENARNTAITNAIGQERNDRDAAIGIAINGEATARTQAINTAIEQEKTNRDAAISTAKAELQGKITAEETERKEADTAFNNRLTTAEGKIGANETAIGELKAKDTELEGKITKNSGDITALQAKDIDLEGKIKTNADNIQTNKNDITTIKQRTAGIDRIDATNETTIEGNVTVDNLGNVKAKGGVTADGKLNVTGASDLKGDVTLGTPNGTNTVTVNGTANFYAAAKMNNDLTVTGDTNLGNTTVDGDLKVTGTITTDKMVFGVKPTNYTEIDQGKVTSKNSDINGAGQSITSSSTFDAEKNEVGFVNNATGDQSYHKQTSDVIMDNVKDRDNSNNRTQTKTETKDIITDENGNSSTTSQTASENKTYLTDKDRKNINTTIDTAKGYDKTIQGENGKTSTTQDELNITNTAKDGTITNDAQNIVNTATTMKTTVTGQATEEFNGGLDTTVTGTENHTVNGKQINTVTEGQENIISGGQTNTITGGQINNITGDQTTTITGNKTETVEGKVTENYKAGQATNVTGNQDIKVSGTQTTTATDIKRNASSGMIDTIDNDYGTNTETKVAGKTTTDVSIKGTGEEGKYIRGANESRDYLIKGTLKNSETKTVDATSTEITDGKGKTSATIQDVTQISGSVTDGTNKSVSNVKANSIDSAVTDGSSISTINQKKDSIQSAVLEGTSYTVISQDKDNVNIASSNGTVGIVGKDIVNNAQNTITNTAGTKITDKVGENTRVTTSTSITDTVGTANRKIEDGKITDTAGDSTVTTENKKGTTFAKTGSKAYSTKEGAPTDTNIAGNHITTGRVDANELGVSDKDGDNTADFSVKAGEGVKASAGNGTTTSSLDVKADGIYGYAADKDGNKTYTKVTATENNFQIQDKDGKIKNNQVNTKDKSENTITNGDKTNTVTSTADGTTFNNSGAAAPVTGASGDGTYVNTTIKGNTITTGKVTMDYAEVMRDLGVNRNANIGGKTTTGSLEVKGESKLTGNVTMENNATVGNDLTVKGITTTKTLKVTENAEIDGNAIIKGDVTARSYKVGGNTYIDANGIHANNQKITDVADGSISEGSKDAVNGGQLYTVKNDLEGKVNKVGANAAAMANLHPMEFDPDSKWNIAAAIGNYGSETAAALGAFYRPNDDVMVNLSTAFGTGENMVGGGVSVRLGKSGNKLSREESNALKDQVNDLTARMDALLSVLNPNMSKDFPDVPENHWAYEAVSRLAGNDIVQGYPDGEFHGERTMTRYEMAEIIYNALSRGAEAEKELVEEFKPELQAMAASEKATAEKAEG